LHYWKTFVKVYCRKNEKILITRRNSMGFSTQRNYSPLLYGKKFGIVLVCAAVNGRDAFRSFPAHLGKGYHNVRALVQDFGKALFRRITMLEVVLPLFIVLAILFSADAADAWNRVIGAEYGKVVIRNYSRNAGLAPVVFDHWFHRSRFTCRLCHVDIGFAMEAGGTNITAAMNKQGLYCGACHDGKRSIGDRKIFAACSEGAAKEESSRCDRCHSRGKKVAREYDFTAFSEKLPKTSLGNGINWEEAEVKGLIKPVDFLEGVSRERPSLKAQKDFLIEIKSGWMEKVLFSHKKHAVWNGCEVCHPEIFPSVKKGATKYSMLQIVNGQYCGVCHDKVAFPLQDCQRCHTQQVEMGGGAPR
jgi:c(7)-type cytochrome triheme protein